MLIAITGPLGSGKSLTMVDFALRYSLAAGGVPIYANFWINEDFLVLHKKKSPHFVYKMMSEADDIVEATRTGGGIFLLDEAYRHLDARMSLQAKNIFLSQLFMYFRKMGLCVIFSAQSSKMMDLRVREIIDVLIKCRKSGGTFSAYIYDYQPGVLSKVTGISKDRARKLYRAYDTEEFIKDFSFPAQKKQFDAFMTKLEEAHQEAKKKLRTASTFSRLY